MHRQRRRLFKRVYFELETRIEIFVNLPFDALDRLALQRRLDAVGEVKADG